MSMKYRACLGCGARLHWRRADSDYCSDVCEKRHANAPVTLADDLATDPSFQFANQ